MGIVIPQVVTEDRASGAQVIDGSLKFDSSKSQHLTRTFSSAGNRRIWTWSSWVKRGNIPTSNVAQSLFGAYSDGSNRDVIRINGESQDTLSYQNGVSGDYDSSTTNALLRDTGWYHFVISYDSNQGTQTNRVKIYVNGELQSKSNDAQATRDSFVNGNYLHFIGARSTDGTGSAFLDGSMSQVYFIDGQVLTPESFGYTDGLTNTWRPKKFSGNFTQTSFNNGTTWSSSLTSNGTLQNAGNAFDGDLSSRAQTQSAAADKTLTFSPPAINFTQKLEVYCDQGSAVPTATWNGNTVNPGGGAWVTVYTGSGTLSSTYPLVIDTESASQYATLKGVRIDGEVLIDGLNGGGVNSFYLPMDGNSPIGEDQSGKGNDWTPVNFGGSVSLDNPIVSGARPILNTDGGGNVARLGVRTDKKTYTVTASGGNYYIDGALKPTLSTYRGGSYTFDYTGATSHPFYLSSLSDGKHNSKAYSVQFDGTGDELDFAGDNDFAFGTGDFTSEAWVYPDSHADYRTIIDNRASSVSSTTGWIIGINAAGQIYVYSGNFLTGSAGPLTAPINTWTHIAYTRTGGTHRLFVNGVLSFSATDAKDYTDTVLSIGAESYGGTTFKFVGKISNVRLVKGQSLYSSNFTPPGTALTTTSQGATASNVKLLCCQDNSVATTVVSPVTPTVVGDPTASNTSPFLFDTNGYYGVNTATSNTTKITIPHWAADTLYYYCTNHSGMGNSISITTDETKADPYAWKCVLAIPGGGPITSEVSPQLNVNSSAKTFTQSGTVASSAITNFYGASTDYAANPDDGASIASVYATSSQSSDFAWGTGDFTWEWWMYHHDWDNAGGNLDQVLIFQYDGGNTSNMLETYIRGHIFSLYQQKAPIGGYIQIEGSNDVFTLQNKQWVHCALVREGGYYKFFKDGVYLGKSTSDTTSWGDSILVFGRNEGNDKNAFDGIFQDIRMYGVAKYTSSFVVPATSPDILPDTPSGVSGGSQLTKITDGAVAFDGTNDYLSFYDHSDWDIGTGAFTVECFVNINSASVDYTGIFGMHTGSVQFQFRINAQGRIQFLQDFGGTRGNTDDASTSGTNLRGTGWHHVALTRQSDNSWQLYVDGKVNYSGTSMSGNITNINEVAIGRRADSNSHYLNGFISNLRFINGTALYTTDFTPPTEPLTNVTNTKLLCCQSNTSAVGFSSAPGDGVSAQIYSSGSISAGTPANASGSGGWAQAFDGDTSTLVYNSQSNTTMTLTLPQSVPFTKLEVYAGKHGSSNTSIFANGVNLDSFSHGLNGSWQNVTSSVTSPLTSLGLQCNGSSESSNFRAIRINDTILVNAITANGNAAATNFNPFTTDIDAVRGQESGYATLNPIFGIGRQDQLTYSDGNLTVRSAATSGNDTTAVSTLAVKGKIYCEFNLAEDGLGAYVGVMKSNTNLTNNGTDTTASSDCWIIRGDNEHKANGGGGSGTSYGSGTFSDGDIIMMAVDIDNTSIWWGKNGIWYASGNPTTNSNAAYTNLPSADDLLVICGDNYSSETPTINVNFGQKPFKYAPPDGFQPLNAANVRPETVIARPDQYVGATLYSGNNGTTQVTTGFQPDFVWLKGRSETLTHRLVDSVRGDYQLKSNTTDGQSAWTMVDILSNGFNVTNDGNEQNKSGTTYVSWCWKAGGNKNTFNVDDVGYASAAAAGLTCTADLVGASVGTKQGFSIIRYQATSGETVAHGLSQQPSFMIIKNMDASGDWFVYHHKGNGGADMTSAQGLNLNNTTGTFTSGSNTFITAKSATTFTVGSSAIVQNGTDDMIAYAWHDVPGLQKFGSYTGNGSQNFVSLDFRPAIVWVKRAVVNSSPDSGSTHSSWTIMDSTRLSYNGLTPNHLYVNKSVGEGYRGSGSGASNADITLEPLSNGFYLNGPGTETNANTGTYIYCAWAEAPTVNLYGAQSNAR